MRATAYIVLGLFAAAAFAQNALEIISLRHRTAEQVLPVLQPLLEPGGTLSGQSDKLLVPPRNLAELRAALAALDTPAMRLLISVRFDEAVEGARRGAEAGGRISNRGDSRLEMRIEDSRSARGGRVDQRLQVLEGSQAFISTGESRVYGEAATGFAVVPRLSGSSVFLEITAQKENFVRGGAVQGQRAASTASGRLGEWFELGAASDATARAASGVLSSQEATTVGSRRIWVLVEEAKP